MPNPVPDSARAVVVGGGISGLACAYRLRRKGVPVMLFEQAARVGGLIDTAERDGFLFELGPQSFLSTDTLLELIASLGLHDQLLRADASAPRYILLDGRLEPAPMAPPGLLTTRLLSARTKLRLLAEPFRRSHPPEGDESIADFVRRKFGQDLLDHLVGPFVSGVYAGDPEKLSLRSAFPSIHRWEAEYGSVLRGAMKSRPPKDRPRPGLCSFRGGIATLVRALGQALGEAVRSRAGVVSLRRNKANGRSLFDLQVSHDGRTEPIAAAAVIVATPTHAAAQLLAGIAGSFRERLERIEYAPVAVVSAGYRRDQVGSPADGFGFLVPRKEGLQVLGTVWNSSLFPGRAPEGMVNFASFAGGATQRDALERSEEEIGEAVCEEVARVLRISGPPVTRLVQRYARALPQYNLGHSQTIAALRELCAAVPGLFLTGNYFEGPAIGACVEQALRTADAAGAYLAALDEVSRTAGTA